MNKIKIIQSLNILICTLFSIDALAMPPSQIGDIETKRLVFECRTYDSSSPRSDVTCFSYFDFKREKINFSNHHYCTDKDDWSGNCLVDRWASITFSTKDLQNSFIQLILKTPSNKRFDGVADYSCMLTGISPYGYGGSSYICIFKILKLTLPQQINSRSELEMNSNVEALLEGGFTGTRCGGRNGHTGDRKCCVYKNDHIMYCYFD